MMASRSALQARDHQAKPSLFPSSTADALWCTLVMAKTALHLEPAGLRTQLVGNNVAPGASVRVVEEEAPQEAFGVELVAVRPEPFRLQLFGYVGDAATQRGMFQNVQTGEVILGGAGHRLPKLGLTVKSFTVAAQTVALPESMSTRQRVATAVVRDEKAGRDITLSQRERVLTGQNVALLAAPGEDAVREVRAGDSFKLGAVTFTVEKVHLAPPSVELLKESAQLAQPDRRTLTPREVELPEGAEKDPGQ
jgi:hypothetical protein